MAHYTKLSPTEQRISDAIEELEIVDAHEHLPPEKLRLARKVDVFILFSNYLRQDLRAAGMPEGWLAGRMNVDSKLCDPEIPIEKRWEMFAPYWDRVRHGSYARTALIAAKQLYGADDINESNYKALSEQISADNRPGLYRRILREKCNIRVALNEALRLYPGTALVDYDPDLLRSLLWTAAYADVRSRQFVEDLARPLGEEVNTLDDYLEMIRTGLAEGRPKGLVGLKAWWAPEAVDRSAAAALFDRIMRGAEEESVETARPLSFFLTEQMLDMAAELGLVVAVHTGMSWSAGDPENWIPALRRHPKTRFDIYHLGMPDFRQAAALGKEFANVWLNLCWCHALSPAMTRLALDELVDQVPINKIIAFGGDYAMSVENVCGHLVMARENVAQVLGHRIERGLLTRSEAIDLATRWFYDNPKELYRLKI